MTFLYLGITIGHSKESGGLIVLGYVAIALLFLYKGKDLFQYRYYLFKILRWYNFIIIGIHVLFQMPMFPCSVIIHDRSYISAEECKEYQNEFTSFDRQLDCIEALYVLFV